MGALLESTTGARLPLRSLHRVGRAPTCDLVLAGPWASREHASVAWNGAEWELRDHGSHNGSTVDGHRVPAGTRVPLRRGAALGFGGESATHVLVDDAPPEPLAVRPDGTLVEGRGGLLVLPPDADGERMVSRDGAGGWVMEAGPHVVPVRDGESVPEGEGELVLCLPESDALTRPRSAAAADDTRVLFRVSLDEEEVALTVFEPPRAVDLGARAHHYVLLVLARARIADALRPDLPAGEHGWIDAEQLARAIRQDNRYVNLQIHRARRQAVDAGLRCAERLIERRPLARQVRFGLSAIAVAR